MGTVKDRLQEYLDYKGITPYRMEKELGKTKGYWKNTKNPTSEFITLFVQKYNDISAEWLLRGKGGMLQPVEDNGGDDASHVTTPAAASPDIQLTALLKMLDRKDDTIRRQAEEIGTLKERLSTTDTDKGEDASGAAPQPFVHAG